MAREKTNDRTLARTVACALNRPAKQESVADVLPLSMRIWQSSWRSVGS